MFIAGISVPVFADVRISEIAWMGTETSSNDEWIELYNDGTEAVDLTGWKLEATDGSPKITIIKKDGEGNIIPVIISAGGYGVLERTDEESSPAKSLFIYTGALSNNGENLRLYDNSGNEQDRVNASDGWLAGDSKTKETMQLSHGSWITALPTPGEPSITSTPAPDKTSLNSDASSNNEKTLPPKPTWDFDMEISTSLPVGNPGNFKITTLRYGESDRYTGYFVWNMGDGTVYNSTDRQMFEHTYKHVGEYNGTIVYSDTRYGKPVIQEYFSIKVTDQVINLGLDKQKQIITLKNTGNYTVDISDWYVWFDNVPVFSIPNYSYIPERGSFIIDGDVAGFTPETSLVALYNPSGNIVDEHTDKPIQQFATVAPQKNTPTAKPKQPKNTTQQASLIVAVDKIFTTTTTRSMEPINTTEPTTKKHNRWWLWLFVVFGFGGIGTIAVVLFQETSISDENKPDAIVDEIEILE